MKTGATMSDRTLAERLKDSVLGVTKDWAKQRKAEERHASAAANRRARLYRASDYYNFTSAAEEVMEEAYMAASTNGKYPALARQVMYQARPSIQDKVGQQLNDNYFIQTLLPNYIEEHGVDWDIAYDERGHFAEPHTEHSIGLGTISVRNYLASINAPKLEEPRFAAGKIDTCGPRGCFSAVFFIEKEGFLPLFEAVHLAERYDLAIMSTKGMSSTAARTLIDNLCQKHQVPLLGLHDFDKAGFSIIGTLKRDTRRFSFGHQAKIIDLGLRLTDVRDLNLEASAEAVFDRGSDSARRQNLRLNGATREEAEFLLKRRVELNALTSGQLVEFIEAKLAKHGIKKLIPKAELLRDAYRLFVNSKRVEEIVEKTMEDIENEDVAVPANLSNRVAAHLRQHPELRWDEAVAAIAENDDAP
jgi:hypothetical protein